MAMDAPSLPKERLVVNGQERTFDVMQALRKKLWENGVRDQAEQNDFIDKYIVAPESRMESHHPGGAAPVTYKYTVSSGGNRETFRSISRLQQKLPTFLKEWRSGQQSDHSPAAYVAGEHTSGSGDSHLALLEDAAAPENSDAGRVASTEQIDTGATHAGNTAPPATRATPPAGLTPDRVLVAGKERPVQKVGSNALDKGAGTADLAGGLTTGAKRQRVERAPAESVIGILAQADRSLLQNNSFMHVVAKLVENERVDKEIELRRISLKEKQLDVCKMVMSDNAEELMTAMAAHKQQALPPPAAAEAGATAAHSTQN